MAIQIFLTEEINYVFEDCIGIKLYKDGQEKFLAKDSKEFNKVLQLWQISINSGYELPALGVSIHDLTVKDMQTGLFIEFLFDDVKYHCDMPFDSLLVKLQKNQCAYEFIRHFDEIYQGRCLHLYIINNNNEFYDYIMSLQNIR